MSRCIDADALEELFREVIGGIAKKPEMNGNLEHMVRASAMVIEMIQDAPTIELEPHWIPCSERYPDMDERVLVYTVAHDYHVWDCMSNRADNYFWEDENGLYHDKYEADMWMPLPEVYREGAQE